MAKFKVLTSKSTALKSVVYLSSILSIFTITDLLGIGITSYGLASEAIATPWLLAQLSTTNYGLGLPKTASTSGGTRLTNPDKPDFEILHRDIPNIQNSDRQIIRSGGSSKYPNRQPSSVPKRLPRLILLTPEDGARTASSQPTLYWYVHEPKTQDSLQSTEDHHKQHSSKLQEPIVGKLIISQLEGDVAIAVWQTDLKIFGGLSSFKLPISSALQPSKTYRWQLTLPDYQQKEVTASGWIVYTPPDANLQKSLKRALTSRDRAKLYAEAGYWFEAIDSYTRWLNFKPEDLKARIARNEILKSGLATNKNLNFEDLIASLNADTPQSSFR